MHEKIFMHLLKSLVNLRISFTKFLFTCTKNIQKRFSWIHRSLKDLAFLNELPNFSVKRYVYRRYLPPYVYRHYLPPYVYRRYYHHMYIDAIYHHDMYIDTIYHHMYIDAIYHHMYIDAIYHHVYIDAIMTKCNSSS